jgi:MFS family permease
MFVAFTYKEYGSIRITNDSFLTTVGSCGAVFNGVGRLFFGMLFDRYSFKVLSSIINIVLLIFSLTMSFIVESEPMFLGAVSLIYFVYGGNYSIYPTQTMRVFGTHVGGKVYCIIFIGFSLGSF